MRTKKVTIFLVLIIFSLLFSLTSLAASQEVSNEKVILEKADNEFLIYYKDLCAEEFQFAVSADDTEPEASSFINAVKDSLEDESSYVAYIDETMYNELFANSQAKTAYVWVKDSNDNLLIEKDAINLADAVTDQIIQITNTTTNRIGTTTAQAEPVTETIDGVEKTVTKQKLVITGIENVENEEYLYVLMPLTNETTELTKLFSLAEALVKTTTTYDTLSTTKQFYDLYTKLIPKETEWSEVENLEIIQPDTADGAKYIVYLKETTTNTTDVKFLTTSRIEDEGSNTVQETIVETVKLPVTFDSGSILFIILAVLVLALIVFIVIKNKRNTKNEK